MTERYQLTLTGIVLLEAELLSVMSLLKNKQNSYEYKVFIDPQQKLVWNKPRAILKENNQRVPSDKQSEDHNI